MIFLLLITILIIFVFCLIKYQYSYFERRGVLYVKPKIPFGSFSKNFSNNFTTIYNELKYSNEPYFGIYILSTPTLVITDLDLIKKVLITDFNYFSERGLYNNERDDPISNHLFGMDAGNGAWKDQRSKLSPTFTSGKMKYMFPLVVQISDRLINALNVMIGADANPEFEFKDLLGRYTTDVIGNVTFGVNCNSIDDPNDEFRVQGRRILKEHVNGLMKRTILTDFPRIAKFFRMKAHSDELINFFKSVVGASMETREKLKIDRNDFFNLLFKSKKSNENPNGFTDVQILAHTFIFYIAGFETSSNTMFFTLLELALNKNVQEKARKEINTVLESHKGELTYESLQEMSYLDRVISETLRKYMPLRFLNRRAIKNYKVPNKNFIIEKGTPILIPSQEIHLDSRYYPDPEKYDPDRFLPDAIQKRHQMTFLGFGEGPRNCIASRFGRMQTKIGLVKLLKNFEFNIGDKLKLPIVYNESLLAQTKNDIWLKVNKV